MPEPSAAVRITGLRKDFSRGNGKRTAFGLLRELFSGSPAGPTHRRVTDIASLEIGPGEIVGLIGDNGAGKTTLLKLIAGLYHANGGRVDSQGRITYFAGLGIGMIPDLTVGENVFLYGAICGISRARLHAESKELLRWAELEDFVDVPLRNLSAGMRTRLALAIASRTESEVLLLDEAFSAGDRRFQGKCDEFVAARRGRPGLILVATHNLTFVRDHCTRAVWLHQGSVREAGAAGEVVEKYLSYATQESESRS